MQEEPSSRLSLTTIVLFAAVCGLIIAQFYSMGLVRSLETKLTAIEDEQNQAKNRVDVEVAKMRESASVDAEERQKGLVAMRDEMDKANRLARGAAGKVKEEALKNVDDLAARIAANEQKIREDHSLIASELDGVKQAASTVQSNVAAVSTEVREVRADVATTRNQLNSTVADLRRVTGDMGVMSGLIATNGKEVAALKQLGDRNYTEFTLNKNKSPLRMGDIAVLLKKADTGHNRYTVELRIDDRSIEKKDRAVNEPVQFYVGRDKQPHELVVNQVHKDQIVGYLAIPKVTSAR